MPVDYITHPFLNYLISSSYRKGRVGLISILESSKVGNSASMRSLTRHIKLYIFLLLFAKLNQPDMIIWKDFFVSIQFCFIYLFRIFDIFHKLFQNQKMRFVPSYILRRNSLCFNNYCSKKVPV